MAEATTKKSGSEKRQRQRVLQVRLSESEFTAVNDFADSAELTPASYARSILLDSPAPRARRRPSVNIEAVARLLANVGKIGSNLNQIAHVFNAGGTASPDALKIALQDVADMRAACMEALGRKP